MFALLQSRFDRPLVRFRSEEDGTVSLFAAILFVLMLMMGGFAVDLMRYEYTRTSLQQSLDRCTLAAASLTQDLDPETVCRDYVAKAGHTDDLTEVDVNEGLNYRIVEASANAVEKPFFAHMVGINQFDVPAASVAEQRITDIEIAMVLDVSGSMINTPSRISNLRTAAKEFVQTVLETDAEQRTSIAIVPYNGQVNLGPILRARYNLTRPNGTANMDCVDLPASAYVDLTISRTAPMHYTANADSFSGTAGAGASYDTPTNNSFFAPTDTGTATPRVNHASSPILDNRWCPPFAGNQIRLPGNNIATLQGQIDGLVPVGATSINAGLKWGLALLDPSARPMFAQLASAGHIPNRFNDRPYNYTANGVARPEMMKVVVLMTDGEHFAEERVNEDYKWRNTGDGGANTSGAHGQIFRANSDGNYSRFVASNVNNSNATQLCNSRPFWVPHLGAWHARPWNGTNPPTSGAAACYTTNIMTTTTGITQQTWPQLFQTVRVSWVAWQLFARAENGSSNRANTYNEVMGNTNNDSIPGFRTRTLTSVMDDQLQDVCDMARDQNVIVFGIAFEAPPNGKDEILACSTTPAHYYDVSGVNIRNAFRSIAAQISQLRLIQ
jgi:Flp pilus assembly protein TadG